MVSFDSFPHKSKRSSPNKEKPYIGVSIQDSLERLLKSSFSIPNLYNRKRLSVERWYDSILALQNEIGEKRLYHMAKESLKGEMECWFNAWEGDTFNNISELLEFFKSEFLKEEDDKELQLWKLLVDGPAGNDLLSFAYKIKGSMKNINVPFNTIKNQFIKWAPRYMRDKIKESDDWKGLIDKLKEEKDFYVDKKKESIIHQEEVKQNIQKINPKYNKTLLLKCKLVEDELNSTKMRVKGRSEYSAVLDTGADVSLIALDIVKKENFVIRNKKIKIKQAVGDFQTEGETQLLLKYNQKIFKIKFHIVDKLQAEIILGNDAMKKLKVIPRLRENKTVLLAEEKISEEKKVDLSKLNVGDDTTKNFEQEVRDLCQEYNDLFGGEGDVRNLDFEHSIDLVENHKIFRWQKYKRSIIDEKIIEEKVEEFLKNGMIEESNSSYISPIVLVKKKNGEIRFCIDYRQLNKITIKKEYPIPIIEDSLNNLADSYVFSTLDMKSGYHQIRVKEVDKFKTAFSTKKGIFQWKRMPFGLVNAPFTFQRVMNKVCSKMLYSFVLVYLDDIVVFSRTPEHHITHLKILLEEIRKYGFRLNIDKCCFLKSKINFLGFEIERNKISIPDEKKNKAMKIKEPKTLKELRSFSGFSNYFQKFIQSYSQKMLPVFESIRKKTVTLEAKEAIKKIQEEIMNAMPLTLPRFEKRFILYADASNFSIGAVLTQNEGDKDVPIFFFSRKLTGSETNYTTTEKECLAIVAAIKHWKHYLCNKFLIKTDHKALTWLLRNKEDSQRLARWSMFLQSLNYEIEYIKGKDNILADKISRHVLTNTEIIPESTESEKIKKISEVHENIGHGSLEATYIHMLKMRWWPGIFRDIKNYVQNCEICRRYRKPNNKFQEFRNSLENPFETVQIDIIGPLPKSDRGNKFIIMAIDTCSRWIEAKALKAKTAKNSALFMIEDVILRHGSPKRILSDQGKEFTAQIVVKICEFMKVRKIFTSAYNPKCNGAIERVNQTLIHKLAKLCNGRWAEWDEYLPYSVYATRIAPRKVSGKSPFELLYGFTPVEISEQTQELEVNEPVDLIFERLKHIRKVLIDDEKYIREREKSSLKKGRNVEDLNTGDIVLRRIPEILRNNKLDIRWEGPYYVRQKRGKGNYVISAPDDQEHSVNRKDLQLLIDNENIWSSYLNKGSMSGDCTADLTLI